MISDYFLNSLINMNCLFILQVIACHISFISIEKNKMQKQRCMGCRTAFQDNEKTLLQNLTTQYKNYELPLKDDKAKWAMLKAIISFLNSQGGTIYLGIHDSQGVVQGLLLTRKEQDNFKLFMKQLLERVHPKIDLNNRQEVAIQFVPVLNKKEFQGKYVVKVIVQQGDPSRIYYFGQKIKLEGPNGKVDEIEMFYAYQRHNMGGTTQMRGLQLMKAIHDRAINPNKVANGAHEGCNPEPPHLELEIRKIYFTNTSQQHFKILQASLELYFGGIQYQNYYLEDQKIICLQIEDENEFKVVQVFITENIQEWNKEIFQDHDVYFQVKGQKDNYFLIQNNPKAKNINREQRSSQRQEIKRENKKMPIFNNNKTKQINQPIIRPQNQGLPNYFPKKYALTFSYINPRTCKQLQDFLINSICKKIEKYSMRYINTIEIFLSSQSELQRYCNAACKNAENLASFGNKGTIFIGKNTGRLRISNYDKNKMDQMVCTLHFLMKDDLRDVVLQKEDKKYSILLKMKDRPTACEWLDRVIQGKYLWQFSYNGNFNRHSRDGKIVIELDLE